MHSWVVEQVYAKCIIKLHLVKAFFTVTSLYPYINKYSRYPIGVPKILVGSKLDDRNVFNIDGLIKVDVLPPKRLYHPVLGVKMHNKLIFSLCFKCTK